MRPKEVQKHSNHVCIYNYGKGGPFKIRKHSGNEHLLTDAFTIFLLPFLSALQNESNFSDYPSTNSTVQITQKMPQSMPLVKLESKRFSSKNPTKVGEMLA